MARIGTRRASRRADGGLAIVETALVLPLLLLLTVGLIEYGWIFLRAQQVTNAARQGARVAARPYATDSEVSAEVLRVMTTANLQDSGYSLTVSPGNVGGITPGQPLTVTLTVPYENIALTNSTLLPTPTRLRAAVSMAKEGP